MFREDPSDIAFKRLFAEAEKLNLHLPKAKKTLKQLLTEKDPAVESRDDQVFSLRKSDLEYLRETVPVEYHNTLRLPIVIMRRMEMGKGTYTILGGQLERFLVKKTLGLTSEPFTQANVAAERGEIYIYKVQLLELIQKLRSLIVTGFAGLTDIDQE